MTPAKMLAWMGHLKEGRTSEKDLPWGQRYVTVTDIYPSPVWEKVAKLSYEAAVPYVAALHWIGGDQALAAMLEIAARTDDGDNAHDILSCTDYLIACQDSGFGMGGGAMLSPGPWPITQAIRDAHSWATRLMERDLTYHVGAATYTMARVARHTVNMLEEAIEKWNEEKDPGTKEAETEAAD